MRYGTRINETCSNIIHSKERRKIESEVMITKSTIKIFCVISSHRFFYTEINEFDQRFLAALSNFIEGFFLLFNSDRVMRVGNVTR